MAAPMIRIFSSTNLTKVSCMVYRSNGFSTHSLLYVDPFKYKMLRKVISKDKRNRDKFDSAPLYPKITEKMRSQDSKPARSGRRVSEGMKKRARYLSSLLYESIAQTVGAGELGIYVEISKVEVLPDLSHVNVYWEGSGHEQTDEQTHKQLDSKAGSLRHTLQTSHAMGIVPKIVFVKDMTQCRVKELEYLLSQADLGSPEEDLHDNQDDGVDTDDGSESLNNNYSDSDLDENVHLQGMNTSRMSFSNSGNTGSIREEEMNVERTEGVNPGDSKRISDEGDERVKDNSLSDIGSVTDSHNIMSEGATVWSSEPGYSKSCKTERSINNSKHDEEIVKSEFKQDMYGLQHDVLMKKVLEAKMLRSGQIRQNLIGSETVDRDASLKESGQMKNS